MTEQARRILVIDDDPATADVARKWFEAEPFEVIDARDGESGIERAVKDAPELILLDLTMPGIDGLEVARRLKAESGTRSIPVVLLTACRDVNSKVEAFAAGADDYITKPFDVQELAARIQAMLLKRQMLRAAERVGMAPVKEKRRAVAIVTGEAVGQVSSQTLQNLRVISSATELPILRPLAGANKDEIFVRAREIGSYDLSAKVPEYCGLVREQPATHASVKQVSKAEQNLDLGLIKRLVDERAVLDLRAYDPDRGRLWVVCEFCRRWNLAPIEERWEALHQLERMVRDRAKVVAETDNITLLSAGELTIKPCPKFQQSGNSSLY